jgi:hypothetical protein
MQIPKSKPKTTFQTNSGEKTLRKNAPLTVGFWQNNLLISRRVSSNTDDYKCGPANKQRPEWRLHGGKLAFGTSLD